MLRTLAPAREAPVVVWDRIRHDRNPGTGNSAPVSEALATLNQRVHDVFNPHDVFVSPVMARSSDVVHV
jgi:hypothetical protein